MDIGSERAVSATFKGVGLGLIQGRLRVDMVIATT